MPNTHFLRIDPSPQVPNNASGVIDHHFLGFGIETASFPDYTGNKSHPNNFSLNMFSTVANRTGPPLPIRVGGTLIDHSIFGPPQNQVVTFPEDKDEGHHSNMTLGASWFESFTQLEQVKWTLIVPLARKNLYNAIEFANVSLDYMTDGSFDALEIGNEPNLYPNANRPRAGSCPFPRARISRS